MKKKPKKPTMPKLDNLNKFLVKKTNRNRPAKPLAKPSDVEAQCVQAFQRIQYACEAIGLIPPTMSVGPHIAFQVIANNLELCNFLVDGLKRITEMPDCSQRTVALDALKKFAPQ